MAYCKYHYKIDFDKVKSIEDVIKILKVMDVSIEMSSDGIKDIKDMLILKNKRDDSVYIQVQR